MPAKLRLTWGEWLILMLILGVVAAMSIPLVAAVRADAERADKEVTFQDLHAAIGRCQSDTAKLPELINSWTLADEPESAEPAGNIQAAVLLPGTDESPERIVSSVSP